MRQTDFLNFMRVVVVLICLLLFLPVPSLADEAARLHLKPLLRVDDAGELSLGPSPEVLLAIAEGERAAREPRDQSAADGELPEALYVRYVPWSLAAPRQTEVDWSGLGRDTVYIIGMHWLVIGILYISPESVSRWSPEDKDSDYLAKWSKKVRNVVWDEDDFYVNYVLHPYWGATYYARGRERGLSEWGSFWFSFVQSALYEFGTEAFFEHPSLQDLIVTPGFGALLGIYFEQVRDRIKRRAGSLSFTDKTILAVTDPLGAVNHQFDRLFGVDTRIRVHTSAPVSSSGLPGASADATRVGTSRAPYLGVSLNMSW